MKKPVRMIVTPNTKRQALLPIRKAKLRGPFRMPKRG